MLSGWVFKFQCMVYEKERVFLEQKTQKLWNKWHRGKWNRCYAASIWNEVNSVLPKYIKRVCMGVFHRTFTFGNTGI